MLDVLMHCASCGGRCHIYVENVSFYSCDFWGLVYLTILHTGDRCYAVQCITTLSNVDDSCSHAIFWNHRFVLQQLLKTRVISSSSEAFWGVIPFSAFFLCFCFFVASAVVWCLHNVSQLHDLLGTAGVWRQLNDFFMLLKLLAAVCSSVNTG